MNKPNDKEFLMDRRMWLTTASTLAILAAAGLPPGFQSAARAADFPVTVRDAWVRAPVAGQTDAGVFLRIVSRDNAALVGATSPVAAMAKIHAMRMANGEMTMRAIPRLPLPAGVEVSLEHRYHLMLMGLKRPLHVGDTVPLTLLVVDASGVQHRIPVAATVRPLDAMEPPATMTMPMP
jgi:Uncharacterized protein conserved in bacteria